MFDILVTVVLRIYKDVLHLFDKTIATLQWQRSAQRLQRMHRSQEASLPWTYKIIFRLYHVS